MIYVDDFIESFQNPHEACAIIASEETEVQQGWGAGQSSIAKPSASVSPAGLSTSECLPVTHEEEDCDPQMLKISVVEIPDLVGMMR